MTADPEAQTDAPPTVLLLTGGTMMGKTYMLERVLAMRFNVVTLKMDGVYSTARRRAGIGQREVIRHPEMLTDGSIDGPLVDKFYSAFDQAITRKMKMAHRYGVAPVLEGHTLRDVPDTERVHRLAVEAYGDDVRVVRAQIALPYEAWIGNMRMRAEGKGPERLRDVQESLDARPDHFRERHSALIEPVAPVAGVEDRVVTSEDDLVALVHEVGITRHRWYQSFSVGPISVNAISDAQEKADSVADEDVKDMDVLDVCCATGAVGMLLKIRGARSVIGIERMRKRYVKCEELRKVLAHQAGVDMRNVSFHRDDIFRFVPAMEPVDTIVALGILHYFQDYAGFLQLMASRARRAMYIEVLRPDLIEDYGDEEAGEPAANGLIPYMRREGGTPKWAAPSGTKLEEIFAGAIPDFEIVDHKPSTGLRRSGPDTSRQIWRVVRRSGEAEHPAAPETAAA